MGSNYFGYDYFCGANVHVSIAGQPVYEVAGIRYQEESSTMPIYGYSSRIFDAVATGQKIIKGHFIINFIRPNYIADILNNGFRAAVLEQQRAEFDTRSALVKESFADRIEASETRNEQAKAEIEKLKEDKKKALSFRADILTDFGSLDNNGSELSKNKTFRDWLAKDLIFSPMDLIGNENSFYDSFLKDLDRQIKEAEQNLIKVEKAGGIIELAVGEDIKRLDADFNGITEAQREVDNLLSSLSNYGGSYNYNSKAREIAKLEDELSGYFEPTGESTSAPLRVNDVGLLGPFNLDIKFAREYTIKIIDCFITSRGSIIQIDESSVVEEYSFFAREIAYT